MIGLVFVAAGYADRLFLFMADNSGMVLYLMLLCVLICNIVYSLVTIDLKG